MRDAPRFVGSLRFEGRDSRVRYTPARGLGLTQRGCALFEAFLIVTGVKGQVVRFRA